MYRFSNHFFDRLSAYLAYSYVFRFVADMKYSVVIKENLPKNNAGGNLVYHSNRVP
jgi:hypothetical protein